jgi:methionyl-tRNA formyltransferase
MNPDLFIVIAFGQILGKKVLDIPRWGAINIHASLLPKYRGAAPIQWAILQDEEKTGLTIMRMDEGLDTGAILFQEEVPILKDETAGRLHDRLADAAGGLIITSLQKMHQEAWKEQPQDHAASTYAPKIEKNMIHIDWSLPAPKISALIRALDPVPGARTILDGKEVKVFSSRVVDDEGQKGEPGLVLNQHQEALVVKTGRGAVGIGEIQAPGRKRIAVADFLRGSSVPEKTILGKQL